MPDLLDRFGEWFFLGLSVMSWRMWFRLNRASLWFWRRRNSRRGKRTELAPPF
jgi:hypothetical protein